MNCIFFMLLIRISAYQILCQYFIYNFELQKLAKILCQLDDIAIDLQFSKNFASMENIRRICYPIVDL